VAISALTLFLGTGISANAQQAKPVDNPVAPSSILNIAPGELPTGFTVQLEPPGPERLFRIESEEALRERMRQEKRNSPKMDRLVFPEEVVLSNSVYDPNWRSANWKPMVRQVEPNYLSTADCCSTKRTVSGTVGTWERYSLLFRGRIFWLIWLCCHTIWRPIPSAGLIRMLAIVCRAIKFLTCFTPSGPARPDRCQKPRRCLP